MPLLSLLYALSLKRGGLAGLPQDGGGALLRQEPTPSFILREDGGKIERQIAGARVASGANLGAQVSFVPGSVATNATNTIPGALLSGVASFTRGNVSANIISAPSAPSDPPGTWGLQFTDDFSRPATYGVNALDPNIWKQREYGGVSAHNGSSNWDYGNGLEATGSTIRVHNRRLSNGTWKVDGFQAGTQNTSPGSFGYHPGFHEFHTRVRMRMSHFNMRGVGGYILMWPLPTMEWSMEFDIVETPGATKSRVDATMHWDGRGLYQLGGQNGNDQYQTSTRTGLDLTQWTTFDCRRTYSYVNGVPYATLRVWVNGSELTPGSQWSNNQFMCRATVPGIASFVAPNLDWARNWYTAPDSSTPADTWMEVDWIRIWAPGGGTPQEPGGGGGTTSKSLSIAPSNPGTLNQASAGAGADWSTTVTTTGITSITWVIVGPAPGYVWRTDPIAVSTSGSVVVVPRFLNDGEFLKVWETSDPSREANSGTVTLAVSATRSIGLSPANPGSRPAGAWPVTVNTTGITSITWVVVNADYSWTDAGTSVATSGSVSINPNFTATGQFLRAHQTSDASMFAVSGQVTIT